MYIAVHHDRPHRFFLSLFNTRRTRAYLTQSGQALPTAGQSSSIPTSGRKRQDTTRGCGKGRLPPHSAAGDTSAAPPVQGQASTKASQHRRRTRKTPGSHRRGSNGASSSSTAKLEKKVQSQVHYSGAEVDEDGLQEDSLDRGKLSRAGGPSVMDHAEERGSTDGVPVAGGNDSGETAAAIESGGPRVLARQSTFGSRGRRGRKEEAEQAIEGGGDGCGGTRSVSLTTSVEVTVVNGVSGGEESASSSGGGGVVEDIGDTTNERNEHDGLRGVISMKPDGVVLPVRVKSRRSTASFIPAAVVDGGEKSIAGSSEERHLEADSHVSFGFRCSPLNILKTGLFKEGLR